MRITNQEARNSSTIEQVIPRVVYSTIGKKSVKKGHYQAIESFRANNPEYKFVVLDDNEAHDYVSTKFQGEKILDIFERSIFGPMRADILRVALMLHEGGVYIDISKRLTIPLRETIPPAAKFVFAHEKNEIPAHFEVGTDSDVLDNDKKLIVQWCMMSSPQNPIFETMINNIERDSILFEDKVFAIPKIAILELTGTYQYTRAIWHHLLNGFVDFSYAGIDFGESSYVLITESFSRNPFKLHYASKRNSKILKAKNETY